MATLVGAAALAACSSAPRGPYDSAAESDRRPREAERLTLRAADLLDEGSPSAVGSAERLLRDALTRDLYHGPAHNNLGIVHLGRGEFYEAAAEFEWARKLMPGHPDPRVNLALTLEAAGRPDEAAAEYTAALEDTPGHLGATQALARLLRWTGADDPRTPDLLREVAMRGESQEWREWARFELARMGP